jgi:hypothetical protein
VILVGMEAMDISAPVDGEILIMAMFYGMR